MKLDLQKSREITIQNLLALNDAIFRAQNDIYFEQPDMVSRIHIYCVRAMVAVQSAGQTDSNMVRYCLTMGFSWSLALANRLHRTQFDVEMWEQLTQSVVHAVNVPINEAPPQTLYWFQRRLAQVNDTGVFNDTNAFTHASVRLSLGLGELDRAIHLFRNTHDPACLDEAGAALCDVVVNICMVANCFNIDMASEMIQHFSDGCLKCHKSPCDCEYPTAKFASLQ